MNYWILAALLTLAYWMGSLWRARRNVVAVPQLKSLPASPPDAVLPRISVVVPARNEGASIESCLRSLLEQDYADLEVIAVDDRSTDSTGEIIDRLVAETAPSAPPPASNKPGADADAEAPAQQSADVVPETASRLVAVHVEELPAGWLGKCNALSQGAAAASGEYLLFTDGDVVFEPSVLRRSIEHIRSREADMMVVLPEVITGSFWEQVIILVFGHALLTTFSPVSAMDRRSNGFVGVGAFNMVRAKTYKRIHGHRFLRLQVVDDAAMGKLVKLSGGSICVAFGRDMVRVRWQESLMGVVRGLEKNSFAAMGYSIPRTLVGSLGLLFVYWYPWIGLFAGPVSARVLCAVAICGQWTVGAGARRHMGMNPLTGPCLPVGAAFLSFALLKSMAVTLTQGGIRWRDSFYSLQDLRKFKL